MPLVGSPSLSPSLSLSLSLIPQTHTNWERESDWNIPINDILKCPLFLIIHTDYMQRSWVSEASEKSMYMATQCERERGERWRMEELLFWGSCQTFCHFNEQIIYAWYIH